MALQKYNQKRNFKVTPEPRGRVIRSKSAHRFYIQKHDASHLHFDFRLEHDGVLKSWAVPKGPSVKPGVRRLAMEVEDHPLEYGHFEGVIPKGEYGGGTVMLWDQGRWQPEGDPKEALKKGRLTFKLNGERLKGTWSLIRSAPSSGNGGKNMWFLIKKNVPGEDISHEHVDDDLTSVASDRSMQEIALSSNVWRSNRSEKPTLKKSKLQVKADARTERKEKKKNKVQAKSEARAEALKRKAEVELNKIHLPKDFNPQLATLVNEPPEGNDWVHEIKFDGYRLFTVIKKGQIRLFSRNGLDWTTRLSSVAKTLEGLKMRDGILDGELIAPDGRGHADFQELQKALKEDRQEDMVYYIFDIIENAKKDLRSKPLIERKQILQNLFSSSKIKTKQIRFSEHAIGEGHELFKQACRLGLEGIIAKKASSRYVGGRNDDWLKVKCLLRQEFVIVGYSAPEGHRQSFGALLLAAHDVEGRLRYVGRTGTGFSSKTLSSIKIKLDRLTISKRADLFDPANELGTGRDVTWVKHKLVAEIKFATWTHHKIVRQAVFQGLREDKAAKDVKLEIAKPLTPEESAEVKPSRRHKATPRQALMTKTSEGETAAAKAGTGFKKLPVEITKPDKVLFSPSITKNDLAQFYMKVEKWIMPHLKNRPLAVKRCPNGHDGMCFFQKHENSKTIGTEKSEVIYNGKTNEYIYVDSLKGLISLVQLGVLEIHGWGTHINYLEKPDLIVFDLDADEGVSWGRIVEAAFRIRDRLAKVKLKSFVKTTGGKGLHIVVPLTPRADWGEVKEFTKIFASTLEAEFPDDYTSNMSKAKRKDKIFIDYLRNGRGATAVLPYSTRAKAHAPVATPITWRELEHITSADQFTLLNFDQRLQGLKKDPWLGFFKVKQTLPQFK